jgi:hypothetical protein
MDGQLLSQNKKSLTQLSGQVGLKYFCSLFKKLFIMTKYEIQTYGKENASEFTHRFSNDGFNV